MAWHCSDHALLHAPPAGKLVLQKLRERPEFASVKGLVRRPEQQAELGAGIIVGDVMSPETWEEELAGCSALVM